ncbi:MAG: glycosyltransferase [Planctomycetota bacterium]|nr:MAG: glycosyltransferase [Planctomycetota bacterium]
MYPTHTMISVITPAHNEEAFIEPGLQAVQEAARQVEEEVEHIVVLNRCSDRTEAIAQAYGARTVVEDAKNLSIIRNAGAAVARGDILVTIDADSRMSPGMLKEVRRRLDSGKYIGGGVMIYPERWSVGIVCSALVVAPYLLWQGVSAGMFWCRKEDFDAIGGFDPRLISVEDVDFARRLRAWGRTSGKRYGTILNEHIVTSCRKFDTFGDWYFVRQPWTAYRIIQGNRQAVDSYFYDQRNQASASDSGDRGNAHKSSASS